MVWDWLSIGVGAWLLASLLTGVFFTRVLTLSRLENTALVEALRHSNARPGH
jgi:hypothetical protein